MNRKVITAIGGGVVALGLCGLLFGGEDDGSAYEDTAHEESYDAEMEDTEGSIAEVTEAVDTADGSAGENVTRCGLSTGSSSAALDENPTRAVRRSTTVINQVVGTKLDGTPLPEDFYMYRNNLSSTYQKAYDQICAGIAAREETIMMSVPVPLADMDTVYFSVYYDHPEFVFLSNTASYYHNQNNIVTQVVPTYFEENAADLVAAVEASSADALNAMWNLGSDVEKVKYAHDYLVDQITYTHTGAADQTIYGGLVQRQCVCAGYSKSFDYMMHKMGIQCTVIVGDAGGDHSWNLLKLDNDYYMMDVTWDDQDNGTYRYNYFDITSAQLTQDHTVGNSSLAISTVLPQAYGTIYSFDNAFGGNQYGTDYAAVAASEPVENVVEDNTAAENADDSYVDSGYENDYDTDAYTYGTEVTYDWWNLLDESWTKEDWTYEDGLWFIYDEETGFIYVYAEEEDVYGAMEENSETIYWLDTETGEWIEE
ncbi:MAG: hypothetical protein K6G23_02310 [Lachnospiraceae bacterium]|nr:hypothetical protein [Lachnospiraceae bacterium]